MVMLRDPYQAPQVRRELLSALGTKVTTSRPGLEENSGILNALLVEKNVMFYILFFIVLVAALCILSAQITFVVQKTREIGMLKALGASNLQISGVFLGQSAIIGVLGVVSGYGLGMLALTYRNEFLHFMNRLTGFELFPASIYGFWRSAALVIDPRDIAIICGLSLVICHFWRRAAGHPRRPVETRGGAAHMNNIDEPQRTFNGTIVCIGVGVER